MDIESIPAGADFCQRIYSAIEGADLFLAIVGPKWRGRSGARIKDEADFVRIEVESAMTRVNSRSRRATISSRRGLRPEFLAIRALSDSELELVTGSALCDTAVNRLVVLALARRLPALPGSAQQLRVWPLTSQ